MSERHTRAGILAVLLVLLSGASWILQGGQTETHRDDLNTGTGITDEGVLPPEPAADMTSVPEEGSSRIKPAVAAITSGAWIDHLPLAIPVDTAALHKIIAAAGIDTQRARWRECLAGLCDQGFGCLEDIGARGYA
jgi:hypothetical protein